MDYKSFGFNDFDFGKMFFPIHKFPDEADLMLEFPILKKHSEFQAYVEVPFNKMIRYIVLAFDLHSPLRSAYKDINEQRHKAALIAGFGLNKYNKFELPVENMVLCGVPEINRMIIRYVSMISNEDFSTYITFTEALRKQQERLFTGDVENEKSRELIANITTLKQAVKDLKEDLLGTKDDDKLNRALYDFVESDVLGITPEEVAILYSFNIEEPITKKTKHGS